jgi:hypothetical protein
MAEARPQAAFFDNQLSGANATRYGPDTVNEPGIRESKVHKGEGPGAPTFFELLCPSGFDKKRHDVGYRSADVSNVTVTRTPLLRDST